jgi:hypothetical protein
MRTLSASELLQVWERGLEAGPSGRALELLRQACPETDAESLANLTIGQRDGLVLRLRQWTFGARLTALYDCSACGELIELEFSAGDLPAGGPASHVALAIDGFELRLRPVTSADLKAASRLNAVRGRIHLLERCLVQADYQGRSISALELPETVVEAAERALAAAEPGADIELSAVCPACGATCKTIFDIVSFFWREIEAWAVRILREVHTLASSYGWSEREILTLSPLRRQCYLDLIGV